MGVLGCVLGAKLQGAGRVPRDGFGDDDDTFLLLELQEISGDFKRFLGTKWRWALSNLAKFTKDQQSDFGAIFGEETLTRQICRTARNQTLELLG